MAGAIFLLYSWGLLSKMGYGFTKALSTETDNKEWSIHYIPYKDLKEELTLWKTALTKKKGVALILQMYST